MYVSLPVKNRFIVAVKLSSRAALSARASRAAELWSQYSFASTVKSVTLYR